MTLPPVIRIFFAMELPNETKEKLNDFIGQLKKKSKSKGIRWTKPENLHVTLQFLAEVKSEHLEKMIESVRASVQQIPKKSHKTVFSFSSLHLFPNPYRPRVIVLDITPQEELSLIANTIGTGIKAVEYQTETRPFHGHLTLGRIKHHDVNLGFLSECEIPKIEEVNVNEVVLFRSEPQPEGSRYTVLEKITLTTNPNPP